MTEETRDDIIATFLGGEAMPVVMAPLAEYDPDHLPMQLWLRGDETIADEFQLEADAVMERLGIKRSRLTQIAGKELRVARTRRGRYVVPVFREVDVEEYLHKSRTPATHLNAKNAIEGAARDLREWGESLSDDLRKLPSEVVASLEQPLNQMFKEVSHTAVYLQTQTDRALHQLKQGITDEFRLAEGNAETRSHGLQKVMRQLEELTITVKAMGLDVAEHAAVLRNLAEAVDEVAGGVIKLGEPDPLHSPGKPRRKSEAQIRRLNKLKLADVTLKSQSSPLPKRPSTFHSYPTRKRR